MSKYIDTLLRRTLLEMMERRPLDDITVVELCNRAEVNRKTFYNHFADISALVGSVVLLVFGFVTYRNDPLKKMRQTSKQKGTLWYNGWTAFLVTLSNPLIIILLGALFAQFAFAPSTPFDMLVSFLSVAGGALLWWYGLTWLIDQIRTKFDNNGIRIINQIIGAIVILVSVIILLGTVTNLYRIF